MQNKQQPENTPTAAYNTRQSPTAPQRTFTAPKPGERAGDLIYSEAEQELGGIWIHTACYDDYKLAYRRAESLTRGFGMPFGANLFLPYPNGTVDEPGFYAFTRADPRPHMIYITPRPFVLLDSPSNATSAEEAGR